MQTTLADFIREGPDGEEANRIIRACVHCGFCNATCPTYQLLGDELDGPRGRIYLIKQALEGNAFTAKTRTHLDRCLTCRSCETTCPSGVRYGRLLDIGRHVVEQSTRRPWPERLARVALRKVLARRHLVGPLLRLGQGVRGVLPARLARAIPAPARPGAWPAPRHPRRLVVLDGCVQPSMGPDINPAAARVLDRLGMSLVAIPGEGCCGALPHHLSAPAEALRFARRNVDVWWRALEEGAEAIVMTASGCGAMVREYGHLLRNDPRYAERAARVSAASRDLSEVLAAEDLAPLGSGTPGRRAAYHPPCTLQHGQQVRGAVEGILAGLGVELAPVPDAHLCCGAAGTYAILEAELAGRLRERKLAALESGGPAEIVTANIGCLLHLDGEASVPVRHWIELVDELASATDST